MNKLIAALPAMRPPFLLLAPICVCLGASIAHYQQLQINLIDFTLALIGALLSAIAVNTLNEYQDHQTGLDLATTKTPFSGGSGLLGKHPELLSTVLAMAIISSFLTLVIGGYFLSTVGYRIIPIGLSGLSIIWLYTNSLNKIPFACLIAPGIGFGFLIVLGSYIVITKNNSPLVWQLAVIPFLLINNLLLLNQYPDIEADKNAGRNHVVIKYGTRIANLIYLIFTLLATSLVIGLQIYQQLPSLFLLALLPCSLSFIAFKGMVTHQENISEYPKYMIMNVIAANLTPLVMALTLAI
ncbi:MAG: prenyltransferase [Thalassotalea sp.]